MCHKYSYNIHNSKKDNYIVNLSATRKKKTKGEKKQLPNLTFPMIVLSADDRSYFPKFKTKIQSQIFIVIFDI